MEDLPLTLLTKIQAFDIILLVIAIIFMVIGIKRGLIGEAVRLVAVIGGFTAALLFYREFFKVLEFLPFSDSARLVLAFVILFLVGLVSIILIGWVVQKLIRLTVLGMVDHVFGGLFGLTKVIILAWIFVRSAESSPFTTQKKQLRKSNAYSILASVPPKVTVPYFDGSKRSVEKLLKNDPLKKLKNTSAGIEQFRTKVDSAKAANDLKTKK